MAQATQTLIDTLYHTADHLRQDVPYTWGHHGQCNCGHLLQVSTQLNDQEIQRMAHTGQGEWTELAEDYCGVTGAPVDYLVQTLTGLGLTPSDIRHIEFLSDKQVLQHLEGGFRWLKHNKREHAILYFEAMARMLEEKIQDQTILAILNTPSCESAVPEYCEAITV
jgi:hypothetical protein